MKVSNTNNNDGNTTARNLMGDEKSSECDCNVTIHKVRYNPTNVDSKMYKFVWALLTLVWWNKFLTKLNLIITRNGLTTGLVEFNLTQLLLA